MATRKPILFCPICGTKIELVAEHTDSAKPGPTKWKVLPHSCTSEAIQRFVDQMEEDKQEAIETAHAEGKAEGKAEAEAKK